MIKRAIKLPATESFFLLGPRQTGKSTLIESLHLDAAWKINLLQDEHFFRYSKSPSLFRKEAEQKIAREGIRTLFIDEIQRVPALLNEVQFLMDRTKRRFIMTGSSARKLKRGGANLLAGRAVERHLHPYIYEEVSDDFDLNDVLLYGSLPPVFGRPAGEKEDILRTYAHVYLREEIQNEGLVRNLGGFSKFLDLAANQSGELLSYSAVARECGQSVRTVQAHYQILEDTLVGFRLEPWHRSVRKRLVGHPKFYLFDTGVTNAVNRRLSGPPDPMHQGRLFEQFVILEAHRLLSYARSDAALYFWRTNHGAEVDLLVERHGKILAAIEIKCSGNISGAPLSGLRAFREEHPTVPCYLISTVETAHELDRVKVLPWIKGLKLIKELVSA